MPHAPKTPPLTAPKGYTQKQGEISLVMSHFSLRYLHFIYQHFSGDLALAIILGEVAHHNVTRHYSLNSALSETSRLKLPTRDVWTALDGCNAFSLSQATGIPRETVRRKIAQLVRRGWLAKSAKGEVSITPALTQHFLPERNVDMLTNFLEANEAIHRLLQQGARETGP